MSVVDFPTDQVQIITAHQRRHGIEPTDGVILILPVVRVDRDDGTPAPRRRRRRSDDGA